MRTFDCICGNTLFFKNTACTVCGRDVGWCPVCRSMTALLGEASAGQYRCGRAECGAPLVKCHNYAVEAVCNRAAPVDGSQPGSNRFCDYCRFNRTVPDLSVPGNREKWRRLESAKRRTLYTVDLLRLPYGAAGEGLYPPLSFEFKADVLSAGPPGHDIGQGECVYTGHANGTITINLREADPVEREMARVDFNEAHRTLIGHFRHEMAHYFWQMLITGEWLDRFKTRFGDHENPPYAEAQARYYQQGPPPDWVGRYISPYATMHPWEDFAETFATYLDIAGMLDTDLHMDRGGVDPTAADFDAMIVQYQRIGIRANEMNREMGLVDLVPEVLASEVLVKLRFVHELVRSARRAPSPSPS
jgi:hypothetical protein